MTADEFCYEVARLGSETVNRREKAKALFQRVRDDTAYEIATGVDKQRESHEKERFSSAED